jgi:hypothetical protein
MKTRIRWYYYTNDMMHVTTLCDQLFNTATTETDDWMELVFYYLNCRSGMNLCVVAIDKILAKLIRRVTFKC